MTERDREIRFRVLETATRVDHEMIATALEYRLTGGNPGLAPDQRARVAEEALFSGSAGRHKALKILRAAASTCIRDAAAEWNSSADWEHEGGRGPMGDRQET